MKLLNKRIFIVEDNTLNRLVYRVALETAGAHIEFDQQGRETISRLRHRHCFDLIILDLMLPYGKSGFELCVEIRHLNGYQTIPIVAVSAAEATYAVPKAQASGFDAFIPKPIYEDTFADQIAAILAGQQLWIEDTRPSFG